MSDNEIMVMNGGGVMSAPARNEIDIQIATAKRYPRTVSKCLLEAETMATVDEGTAESCGYLFTRDGKQIAGPSIRCAEILECAWENIRAGARVLEITDTHVTAEGVAFDLEKNVCNNAVKTLKIVGKKGRFSDDMIALTCDRACALAKRNAIFATIPRAYVDRVYRAAMKVAVGDNKSLTVKRQQLLDKFLKNWGITPEQVCAYIGKAKPDDLDLEDLGKIIGLGSAIKDGDVTIDEVQEATYEAQYKPDPKVETVNRDAAIKTLDALADKHKITPVELLNMAKRTFKRPLSKLAAAEIEMLSQEIRADKELETVEEPPFEPEPPAPSEADAREALMERIAKLSEGMDAKQFDAVCAKVIPDTAPEFMNENQLELLVIHLSQNNKPKGQ